MTPQELQSLSHQLAATLAAEEEKKQKQETMKALMREGLKGSEKFDADKWTQKLPFYPSDIPEGGFMEQKLPFYPSEVQGDPEDWSQPMSVHSNFDEGGQYTGNFHAGQVDPYKSDPRGDAPEEKQRSVLERLRSPSEIASNLAGVGSGILKQYWDAMKMSGVVAAGEMPTNALSAGADRMTDSGDMYKGDQYVGNSILNQNSMMQGSLDLADLPIMTTIGQGTTRMLSGKKIMQPEDHTRLNIFAGPTDPPKTSADLPSLRGLPRDEAIKLARSEPHLIDAGKGSRGAYIGGPENIKNYDDLLAQRELMDEAVRKGADGADWYDRTQDFMTKTSDNPRDATWAANQHAQYSAGVSPENELGYAVKETNSLIANDGNPVKVARPAQRLATMRALEANDPSLFQLGNKTGKYAKDINPSNSLDHATGTNDFRHFRTMGHTEVDGTAQKNALGLPAHKYADYETALAADRASTAKLAGRDRWTGPQVQAAPWISQKADDLLDQRRAFYMKRAEQRVNLGDNRPINEIAYDFAFDDARKTIADFADKHTAFGTYEAQPYAHANHLPKSAEMDDVMKWKFANDPLSRWDDAKGRDGLYSGMRQDDTGIAMRVRETENAQGVYTRPDGVTEYNPAKVARPMVGFDTAKGGIKTLPDADRSLLTAGEATRALVDTQGAGAFHKNWANPPEGVADSFFLKKNEDGILSGPEISRLKGIMGKHGYGDVVDTGDGVTLTSFMGDQKKLSPKTRREIIIELMDSGDYKKSYRTKTDSGYIGFEPMWEQAIGSEAVSREFLKTIDELPKGTVKALTNNPNIPQVALKRLERNEKWAKTLGPARKDIQHMLKIIGEGKGWVERLRKELGKGTLPAILVAPLIAQAYEMQEEGGDYEM